MGGTDNLKRLEGLVERWVIQHDPIILDAERTGREISGSTINETLEHLSDEGGSPQYVLNEINAKLRLSSNRGISKLSSIDPSTFFDERLFFSDELFALLTWLCKIERQDVAFCYSSGSQERYGAGHKLYEVAPISMNVFVEPENPFGVSCRNFEAAIDKVCELSAKRARDRGLDKNKYEKSNLRLLFDSFNVLIGDGESVVTPEKLRDPQLWVRYEASQFFLEMCKVVTGRSDFIRLMCEQNFPMYVRLMTGIMDIGDIFAKITSIANKYNSLMDVHLKECGTGKAVVTVTPTDDQLRITGPRFNACMQLSCDVSKYTMEKIPRLYGLPMRRMREISCCVDSAKTLSDVVDSQIPHGTSCEYRYEWFPIQTGWRRLVNPAVLAGLANIPLIPAVLASDMGVTEKASFILSGLILATGTAAISKIRQQGRKISEIEEYHKSQEKSAEQQRHDLLLREVNFARNELERTYSALYLMSINYSEYLRLLGDGDMAGAKDRMDVLRKSVSEYLSRTAFKEQGTASLSDLRRKLDAASLFIAFGEVVDGTFDPLTGRSGSAVFMTNANAEGAKIAKRFALKEMGTVEALVYDWFSRRSLYDRQRFPTPDILAYRVVPTRDEDGSPLEVPIMMMETIEGPTLYDFFRRLDARVSPGQVRSLAEMKDRMIEGWINRYCYIAEESQSTNEGSLGKYLDSKGAVRVAAGDYVSKIREVFDAGVVHVLGEDRESLLPVVAEQLGEALAQVRKVPFADMSPLNGSMPARGLYSKVLSICRGIDQSAAEADVSGHAVDEVTGKLLDEIVANISDELKSSELFDACSEEIVRFDFEKLRMETVEFDDLCHIVDFFPYGPSPERRGRMNALYIALRYIPGSSERKQDVMGLLDAGRTSEAVAFMGEEIDYRGLESQRAIVSIYRNLRWMRFYKGLDDSKFDAMHSRDATIRYHSALVVQDISRYLGLNPGLEGKDVRSVMSEESLRAEGLPAGLAYLKDYLEGGV